MRTEGYAAGLVEELRGYTALGMDDRAAEVKVELERLAPQLPRALVTAERDMKEAVTLDQGVDPSALDGMPEVQRLRELEANLSELGYLGGRRTTRTPAAPERAVTPPAK